jgi:hypothetical protein
MNDLQQVQSDAAFASAQAAYDTKEPPEEEECRYCGGDGRVVVATICASYGCNEYRWPVDVPEKEIDCPFCRSTWAIRR